MSEGNNIRRVRALSELPRSIAPPEGLWSRIAPQLEPHRAARPHRPWLAAAAVVLALAAGALLGRLSMTPPTQLADRSTTEPPRKDLVTAVPVTYVTDPRYLAERAALLKGLNAQLAALPPDTQKKVVADLATIHQSMLDLQAALGRDPSNALLQELLVNTYQDEMHVLVAVREASESGRGI
jgi:hypothetical protein